LIVTKRGGEFERGEKKGGETQKVNPQCDSVFVTTNPEATAQRSARIIAKGRGRGGRKTKRKYGRPRPGGSKLE